MRELGQRRLHLSLRCPHAFAQRNMYRRADTYAAQMLSGSVPMHRRADTYTAKVFISGRKRGNMAFQLEQKKYNWTYLIRLPFECSPLGTVGLLAQKTLTGLVNVLWIPVEAGFIDAVLRLAGREGAFKDILPWAVLMLLIIFWKRMGYSFGRFATKKVDVEGGYQINMETVKKRSHIKYALVEDRDTWELVSRVCNQATRRVWEMLQKSSNVLIGVIRIVGTFVLVFTQIWWAGLALMLLSVFLLCLSLKSGGKIYEAHKEREVYERRGRYLGQILTSRESAGERTLFHFSQRVDDGWQKQRIAINHINRKASWREESLIARSSILTNGVSVFMAALLAVGLTQDMTIGMFIALSKAVFEMTSLMSNEVTRYGVSIAVGLEFLKDFTAFANLEEEEGTGDAPAEELIPFESLEFKHVTFSYPGFDRPVLRDLSFTMRAGEHYAFVGENGCGKTTITKLITGLYKDYQGEILLNGRELSTYTAAQKKAMFSGVYQDFARYQISVGDNIRMGCVPSFDSEESKRRMVEIAGQLGLKDEIDSLPAGYDTQLGRLMPDSVDLSGGQWQRVAMARALMSRAPMLILDEPTASLDPISESRLYEQFGQISQGRTTLFISHRLGSTHLADHIFVLKNGGVLEEGSHKELMGLDGLYREMYESQRSWYQEETRQ